MKQMAKLAQANRGMAPELVVLDEPTNGLDPSGAPAYAQLVREMKESMGMNVLMYSH